MYYLVTVGYESEQTDRQGNPRIQKTKYVVHGQSVEEVTIIMAKYINEDMRSGDVLSIAQMPIECVLDNANTPKYY